MAMPPALGRVAKLGIGACAVLYILIVPTNLRTHFSPDQPSLFVINTTASKALQSREPCSSPPGRWLSEVCPIPNTPQPDPCITGRERCYISYGIWGHDDWGARTRQNIALARVFYPGWTVRIYHDHSISSAMLATLRTNITELVEIRNLTGNIAGMFWRFLVMFDPNVDRWIVRDADSKLGSRERAAVDEWIASGRKFHIMNDHPAHCTWPIIGCCFGGVKGAVPAAVKDTIRDRMSEMRHKGGDQTWLQQQVWPHIRLGALTHSSWRCVEAANFMPFPKQRFGKLDFVGCNWPMKVPEVPDRSETWLEPHLLDDDYVHTYQRLMQSYVGREPHKDGTCPPKCRRHPSWRFC